MLPSPLDDASRSEIPGAARSGAVAQETPSAEPRRWRELFACGALLALVLALRVMVIYSPFFQDVQYERAPMGLEALAILRGETPVMNWSEPYHGTVFSYLLAPFYALGRDPVLTYGWVSVCVNLLGPLAAYGFARRLWGQLGGMFALAYLAMPSAFFTFHDVNSYALFVSLGSVACFAGLRHILDSTDGDSRWLWLSGLCLGLATWCHQLGVCFVVAVGVTMLVARRARFFRSDAWRLVCGFLIGSAPLWLWNLTFHWIVLRNFTASDYTAASFREFAAGAWESIGSLLAINDGYRWPQTAWNALWLPYGQLFFAVLVVSAIAAWWRGNEAIRVGVGMMLALIATTLVLYAKSRWGVNAGFSRYLIPLCSAIPVLVAGLVSVAVTRSRALGIAVLVACVVPGFNDHLHYFDREWTKAWEGRGAKFAISALDRLGVTRAYANVRVSLPITLASRERIIASDFYGVPYQPYLSAVDDAPSPAIIAHDALKIPAPDELERSLGALGGRYRRMDAPPYRIFYDFHEPDLHGGWLAPAAWRLSSSVKPEDLAAIVDRDMLTVWSTDRPRRAGDWVAIDLGETHRVEEVHLLSGVRIYDFPDFAVVETSLDGERWTVQQQTADVAWYWWNGHPKHDNQGRASFYFTPVPARYLRIRLLRDSPQWNWSIAEIFVRAADAPESQAGALAFRQGLLAERRGQIGINYHTIHSRFAADVDTTPWGEVMQDYWRAMRANPDEPEAAYRFGAALWLNRFVSRAPDLRNAHLFRRLGLEELARREYARCAGPDTMSSLCVGYALAAARDPAERARLEALRRRFEQPTQTIEKSLGAVELHGTRELPSIVHRGEHFPLELIWKCRRTIERDYTVFVHFDAAGRGHFAADHGPAGGRSPTSAWEPGELVRDEFEVDVPKAVPPGRYDVSVGLWDPKAHLRLRRGWFGRSNVVIGSVEISP